METGYMTCIHALGQFSSLYYEKIEFYTLWTIRRKGKTNCFHQVIKLLLNSFRKSMRWNTFTAILNAIYHYGRPQGTRGAFAHHERPQKARRAFVRRGQERHLLIMGVRRWQGGHLHIMGVRRGQGDICTDASHLENQY